MIVKSFTTRTYIGIRRLHLYVRKGKRSLLYSFVHQNARKEEGDKLLRSVTGRDKVNHRQKRKRKKRGIRINQL